MFNLIDRVSDRNMSDLDKAAKSNYCKTATSYIAELSWVSKISYANFDPNQTRSQIRFMLPDLTPQGVSRVTAHLQHYQAPPRRPPHHPRPRRTVSSISSPRDWAEEGFQEQALSPESSHYGAWCLHCPTYWARILNKET